MGGPPASVTLRDLPLNWDQHAKLLPEVDRHMAEDVKKWTPHQVADYVALLPGCAHLAKQFEEQVSLGSCPLKIM